jgi:hypothetical protein
VTDSTNGNPIVARIAAEMEKSGFSMVKNFLSADELAEARIHVSREVKKSDGQFFAIHGCEVMEGSFLGSLGTSLEFKKMLTDLYALGTGLTPSATEGVFPVIRCMQGSSGRRQSHFYHFDATVVTALLPLFIPTGEQHCGDLISFPNIRPVRSSAFINLIEKGILHNRLSQKITAFAVKCRLLKPLILKLEPGNLYFFWGYRSLHANDYCDPGSLRATALYHFGDPHRGTWIGKFILGSNKRHAGLDPNGLRITQEPPARRDHHP